MECYVSFVKVLLPKHKKKQMYLVLIYGLGKQPMMLLTNKVVDNKSSAIKILRTYMSRWRIEEYFKFKKQQFSFEDFRVRSLQSIKNLNLILTIAIGFIGIQAEKFNKNILSIKIIERAKVINKKVKFYYYQFARGIKEILYHAKCGIESFLNIEKRKKNIQLCFRL